MELKTKLNKPYTEEERADFIVEQNHRLGYEIRETKKAIEAWGYTEEEIAEQEHERIQALYMTRSDFFDGLIKAFGIDEDDLLPVIQQILNNLAIEEIQKIIDINNYKNALNFYRKHDLFTLLSGVTIPVTEQLSITIEAEQWDRFFDETSKKNPEAYKELLPEEEE